VAFKRNCCSSSYGPLTEYDEWKDSRTGLSGGRSYRSTKVNRWTCCHRTGIFQLDPFLNALFVFCNRKKDKLKILFWDHNGFWLYYRRLENGLFGWPDLGSVHPLPITPRQLNWLLDGLPLNQRHAHPSVQFCHRNEFSSLFVCRCSIYYL